MNERRKLLPKLRFPEFRGTEPWKPLSLGEASSPVTERVGERRLMPVSISAGIGFVPQAEKFGRDISGNQYQLYTLVRDGDFAYNKGNSLKFPEGCVYLLHSWGQVAAPNVFICFRLKEGFSNGFFQNCFEANVHGKQLKKHITSGARSNGLLNIGKEAFFGIEIPIPSSAEQRRIADILGSLDDLIAAQARKVDALKTYKDGLMQQLFPREGDAEPRARPQQFRKAGEWTTTTLGKHIRLQSGFAFSSAYFGSKGRKLVTPRNFTKSGFGNFDESISKYTTEEVSPKYICKSGDLLVLLTDLTPTCELLGKPLEVLERDGSVLLNQRIAKVELVSNGVAKSFLRQLFLTESYGKVIVKTASGSTVKHSSNKVLENMAVVFPCLEEQQHIADCLTSLDNLITATTEEHQTLKTHKKGLMQQLFPSAEESVA